MTPHAIIRAAAQATMKSKVRCPNCGYMNDAHAEKCARCGYPLRGSEKKAGFWGDLTGKNYKKALDAAATEIGQVRSEYGNALAQAGKASVEAALARRGGTPNPHLEAAELDAHKRFARAAEAYKSRPSFPSAHPKSQEAWRQMAKARRGTALGLGALGLGAYGLYRATRPKTQAEKKAGVIVGGIKPTHSKQDLEDERASIHQLLASKKMWEGDRHTGRFTPRGAGTFLGALGGTLGAFRGATLDPEHSVMGTRLGDAAVGGALGATANSAIGWALAKHGLKRRLARVESALAEKQKSEKTASVEYRGHTFPGYNVPIKSSRPEKKKMVLAKKGTEVRLIHFGQQGYKHNYSEAAKKNYLARSAGIRGKSGLTKDDKFSANYWARRELWPKNEPADGTAKDRPKTASSEKEENFAHKAEIAGLGAMMVPYAAHVGAKIPGIRRVAGPVSHFYHRNPTVEHVQELAALGTLMAPSIRHLMAKRKEDSAKVAESEDYLLGQIGRAAGNALQKYPVPTLAAAYGVTKLPAIGKALRERKTEERMPVNYGAAVTGGSIVRHGDPETAKYLARRAFGPV